MATEKATMKGFLGSDLPQDSPEDIAAADQYAESVKNADPDIYNGINYGNLNNKNRDGFVKIANDALSKDTEPFVKVSATEPFKPQKSSDDTEPFQPLKGLDSKIGKFIEDDPLLSRIAGTAQQLTDIPIGLAGQFVSHGVGIGEMLDGKTPAQASEAMQGVKGDFSATQQYGNPKLPTNPFIDTVMGAFKKVVDTSTEGYKKMAEMAGMDMNPATEQFLSDATALGIGGRPANEVAQKFYPNPVPVNRRIGTPRPGPEAGPEVTAGEPPVEPFNPVGEQAKYTENANQQWLSKYDQNPVAYGVDESGARNPYQPYYDMHPDISFRLLPSPQAYKEAGPDMKGPDEVPEEEPTFMDKHNKMVELGNYLIDDMDKKGLSPKEVVQRFWNETYPDLPDEVQVRFGNLSYRQQGKEIPDTTAELQQMQKWMVALMHEANNYPWTPKAKDTIENRADLDEIQPEGDAVAMGYHPSIVTFPFHEGQTTEQSAKQIIDWVKLLKEGGTMDNPLSANKLLKHIAEHSGDPFERILARVLHDPTSDIDVYLASPDKMNGAWGLARSHPEQRGRIFLNDQHGLASGNPLGFVLREIGNENNKNEGYSTSTFLHEVLHIRDSKLLELGRDSRTRTKYPELARFYDELSDLYLKLIKFLPKDMGDWADTRPFWGNKEKGGSPGHELISWGLSERGRTSFRNVLDNVWIDRKGTLEWYDKALEKELTNKSNTPFTIAQVLKKRLADLSARDGDGKLYPWLSDPESLRKFQNSHSKFLDLQGNTAFDELKNLVLPILETYKGVNIPANDARTVMQGYGGSGWMTWDQMSNYDAAEMPKSTREMLPKLVTPFKTWNEMAGWSNYYKYKDLNPITGSVYPTTMVKNIANLPPITFAVSKVRDTYEQSHFMEKMLVGQVQKFELAPVKDQMAIVKALTEINRPENQIQLQAVREQPGFKPQPNAMAMGQQFTVQGVQGNPLDLLDSELQQFGLNPTQIQLYRETVEPLFHSLRRIDNQSVGPWGRNLDSKVVGYYPRAFGFGPHVLQLFNPTGKLVYYRRYQTYQEMRDHEGRMLSHPDQAGFTSKRETAKDFTDYKGMLLNLIQIDPNTPTAKMAEATLKATDRHRRTQEFERNANGVAGFIGQDLTDPKELERSKQLIYYRIRQTVELWKAYKLLGEIMEPMQADPRTLATYPHAVSWIRDFVNRELGGDINLLRPLSNGFNWIHNEANKTYLRMKGYKINPTEMTINPSSAKMFSKYASGFGSAWVLAGNIPNLVTNSFTIPLVSLLGGWPDALMLKTDPVRAVGYAIKAHTESMADIAALGLNQVGINPGNNLSPQVSAFIRKAIDRGVIVANAFTDLPQMRGDIEKTAIERGVETTLNIPRRFFNDPVEIATNYASVLYYNRLVKMIKPNLSEEEHYKLVIDLTKRYTGDYAPYNKALMWERLGMAGQMASNFSIWTGTRIAQAHELVKNVAVHRQVAALITLMAGSILTAGLQGMAGAQDYENLRQVAMNFDVYLPPQDRVMKDLGTPEWLRNGIILNSAGVDMATRGKWSGWSDLGGVTYALPGQVYHIMKYLIGRVTEHTGAPNSMITSNPKPAGPSVAETSDFVKSLPSILKPTAQQQLLTRNWTGDKTTIINKHGGVSFTQNPKSQNPFGVTDKQWNWAGFRTNRQAEEQRDFYNSLYDAQVREKTKKALKETALDELLASINSKKQGDTSRAKVQMRAAAEDLVKLAKFSPAAVNSLEKDILNGIENESDGPKEKLVKKMMRTKDAQDVRDLFKSYRRIVQSSGR